MAKTQNGQVQTTEILPILEEAKAIVVPTVLVSEKEARLARLHFASEMLRASDARKAELRVLGRWAGEAYRVAKDEGTCNLGDLRRAAKDAASKF